MTTSISSIAKARYEFEISITNFESCKSAVESLVDSQDGGGFGGKNDGEKTPSTYE